MKPCPGQSHCSLVRVCVRGRATPPNPTYSSFSTPFCPAITFLVQINILQPSVESDDTPPLSSPVCHPGEELVGGVRPSVTWQRHEESRAKLAPAGAKQQIR